MKKTAKAFTLYLACLFMVLIFYPKISGAKEANLTINGEYVSADLKGVSLNAIFEALQREKGIWFKGNLSLLDEKISVQFTNHSLEDGMKRILSFMNYCLVFEGNGALVGAILIGKEKGGSSSVQYTAGVTKKPVPLRVKNKNVNPVRANDIDIVKAGPPIGISTGDIAQNLKNFKVITNTQPQVAPAEMTAEQIESMKAIQAQPSQSAPDEMTAEQIASMKAMRDKQPQSVPNK
jgi:hypothetical protein